MKKIIFPVILLSFAFNISAQDFIDNALLFSRTRPAGSARIQAIGGAQISLGGDFSSGLSNPAGLGMYNRSEFTISPGLNFQSNTSLYGGVTTDDSKITFNIPGLSFAYHHESENETGFLGGTFGVSMTRINDLNRNFTYRGTNNENSLIDYFINNANGVSPDEMLWIGDDPGSYFFTLTGLAYNTYLIEDDPIGSSTYNSVLSTYPYPPGPGNPREIRTIDQMEMSRARGAQNQWTFSYGANFDDKLFLGAGLGVVSLRYKVQQNFVESNFRYELEDPGSDPGYQFYDPIDYYETEEDYDIRGSGYNFTIGAIYRPIKFLQVGASVVTPTVYNIVDNYTARIDSYWKIYDDPANPQYPPEEHMWEEFGQPLISEYTLRTPMKVSGGATFISKFGFITADVEFVNYSKAKYTSQFSDDFSFENDGIKGEYSPVVNYRAGAEYRYEQYRLRAGYSFMADPYRNDSDANQSIHSFSGGVGYRGSTFFIDAAAVFMNTERNRSPYFVDGVDPIAFQKFRNTNYIVTVGFTF
jgi:hypothetical protein